jgi:hypothetical protein
MTGREITKGESESLRETKGNEKQVRNLVQQMKKLLNEFCKVIRVKNCAILGHYAASSGNLLPTFRDNLPFPWSRTQKSGVKNPKDFWVLEP